LFEATGNDDQQLLFGTYRLSPTAPFTLYSVINIIPDHQC